MSLSAPCKSDSSSSGASTLGDATESYKNTGLSDAQVKAVAARIVHNAKTCAMNGCEHCQGILSDALAILGH